MPRSAADLRSDALAIWHAGLEAVQSDRLVKQSVRLDGDWLLIGDDDASFNPEPQATARSAGSTLAAGSRLNESGPLRLHLSALHRIAVVGAGKAGTGMAVGLLEALGPKILQEKQVHGWLNVPADCIPQVPLSPSPTLSIHLHPARPGGINEPTEAGLVGAEKILEIASSLGPDDLCFCLLSGGGSALLPAPVPGVSLAEKQSVTRELSSAGANIEELNTVRKQLSRIKGGGLARACRAGHLITLIISDVLGDPLETIASGPTVADTHTPADALAILDRYHCGSAALRDFLQKSSNSPTHHSPFTTHCINLVIGNNALAVDAAGIEAERRGYSHAMHAATSLEGPAEEIGRDLARMALKMATEPGPDCLITGGEPTVKLAPLELRGKGGRNQQLVLAALSEVISAKHFALLSAGTDGEDGPTDAAGAILDADVMAKVRQLSLDPTDYLRRTDAYHFFEATGGLIKTGPTHTNVCDVRVVVVDR